MLFYSTRDKNNCLKASDAILKGLASDGGLFVPSEFPKLENLSLDKSYADFAYDVLKPFFQGDVLEDYLHDICTNAFNFDIPLKELSNTSVLELFHGPTSAFKDFGARFLAFTMEKLLELKNEELTILVATSGDTGGAVASAFHNRKNLKVKVLYPSKRVAARQEKQLTCYDNNISSYEVKGSFDDCQKMVKDAFLDSSLSGLSSANSINLGRLLPQMVYYVYTSMVYYNKYNKKPVIIIPSGNVGNSTGAFWAKMIGSPIEKIVLAVNANTTIVDYLNTGKYVEKESVQTLANAMDVGAPSNMERIFSLFSTYDEVKANLEAYSVSDDQIKETIVRVYNDENYIMCPHTACAEFVRKNYFAKSNTILVSTAHPAKFETIVEPLIKKEVEVPEVLAALINKESNKTLVKPMYKEIF